MQDLADLLLHIDRHLLGFVQTYGSWVYALLFSIIFCETGLVVTPFLPGDSLLFATGALAAQCVSRSPELSPCTSPLNAPLAFGLLALAAFLGNATNYTIGRLVGARVLKWADGSTWGNRVLKREYVAQAHQFFERHGRMAVMLSRFMPILRTFVPFVAGAAEMSPHVFLLFNLAGAVAWVAVCLGAGFVFGNVPIVKEHFSLVTVGIVLVSLLPMLVEYVRARARRR
jgi:membrane-associated protein